MSAVQDEFNEMVYMVDANIADLDKTLRDANPDDLDWADALVCRDNLTTLNGTIRGIRERLDNILAEQMGTYQRDNVKRHRKKSRREWQSDDLLRIVLDSRIVDGETGEVESQVDALKAVYGLKGYNASVKELEKRGIDVDEWCVSEERGWTLEVR